MDYFFLNLVRKSAKAVVIITFEKYLVFPKDELELSFEAAEKHLSNDRKVLQARFFLKNKHNFFY